MSKVILKWNPAISSYTMKDFVNDMSQVDDEYGEFNWSVWDYNAVKEGDEFFWLKVGYGQNGIVGHGSITSDPYEGEDWSGRGRKTFYVDFMPDMMICPDAARLLDADALQAAIPDFDWRGGHSGLVLSEAQAEKLHALWREYTEANREAFEKARPCNVALKRSIEETIFNDGNVEVSVELCDENCRVVAKDSHMETSVHVWNTDHLLKAYGCSSLKMLLADFKHRYGNPHAIPALTQDLLRLHIPFSTSHSSPDEEDEE